MSCCSGRHAATADLCHDQLRCRPLPRSEEEILHGTTYVLKDNGGIMPPRGGAPCSRTAARSPTWSADSINATRSNMFLGDDHSPGISFQPQRHGADAQPAMIICDCVTIPESPRLHQSISFQQETSRCYVVLRLLPPCCSLFSQTRLYVARTATGVAGRRSRAADRRAIAARCAPAGR